MIILNKILLLPPGGSVMEDKNKNITLISFQNSIVVKGLQRNLQTFGYHVEMVTEMFQTIREKADDTALFITYLPEDLIVDQMRLQTVATICETVTECKKNMILIGAAPDHEDLLNEIPGIVRFTWVNRPVDMTSFEKVVEGMFTGVNAVPDRKKRILIVDDDPSYAKMIREWIKDIYKVGIVTAGMQAINFLLRVPENDPVDMILLDYEMPIADGPQVFQMLKQNPDTARVPVIFLTGIGSPDAVKRVLELKPEGYLLKSTTRSELLNFLKEKLP